MSCRKVKIDDGGGVDSFFSRKLIREDILAYVSSQNLAQNVCVRVLYYNFQTKGEKPKRSEKERIQTKERELLTS